MAEVRFLYALQNGGGPTFGSTTNIYTHINNLTKSIKRSWEKSWESIDRVSGWVYGCYMNAKQAEQREVYIEVEGGIAHLISAPDDVDVYIIDLDEEKEIARA